MPLLAYMLPLLYFLISFLFLSLSLCLSLCSRSSVVLACFLMNAEHLSPSFSPSLFLPPSLFISLSLSYNAGYVMKGGKC